MKRLMNYIVVLSLSLFVFGYDSVSQTPSVWWDVQTIDKDSEEYKHFETTSKGIVHFKGGPFSGSVTEYYENGQLKEKAPYIDGKMNGVAELYYENGQLKQKVTFIDGKEDSPFEFYYKNGQLEQKGTFIDGEQDGVFEEYNEDGTRK